MRVFSLIALLVVPTTFASPASAQDDEVLVVEKKKDQRGRDHAMRLLRRTRTKFHFEELSPRDLCRTFSAATGNKISFSVGKKAVARASARNRIKRVIRDRFRTAQHDLPAVDLVVRVVGPVDRARLHRHLDRLFLELKDLPPPQSQANSLQPGQTQ